MMMVIGVLCGARASVDRKGSVGSVHMDRST